MHSDRGAGCSGADGAPRSHVESLGGVTAVVLRRSGAWCDAAFVYAEGKSDGLERGRYSTPVEETGLRLLRGRGRRTMVGSIRFEDGSKLRSRWRSCEGVRS